MSAQGPLEQGGGRFDAWPAGPGPSASVQATMSRMTEQLRTVIDAAERAADAIRLDAERQAQRYLIEAQREADRLTAERVRLISELTDELVRQADTVRDQSERMSQVLDEAIASAAARLGEPAPDKPGR